MTGIKYNICVQDKNGVWTPVAGDYESEKDALNTAHATQSAYAVILGKHSPLVMVQRWEKDPHTETWQPVQWHVVDNGGWMKYH